MDQREGQVEPAAHAAAVGPDGSIERGPDVHEVGELADAPARLGAGQGKEPSLEIQQLATRLLGVEGRLLERDADAEAHLGRLADDVAAGNGCAPRGRPQERAQHPNQRGLARAIGPEEAVDLTARDGQVDAADRLRRPERANQAGGDDRRSWIGHARRSRDHEARRGEWTATATARASSIATRPGPLSGRR